MVWLLRFVLLLVFLVFFLVLFDFCFFLCLLLVVFCSGMSASGTSVVRADEPAERDVLRCSRMAMPECQDDSSSEAIGLQVRK